MKEKERIISTKRATLWEVTASEIYLEASESRGFYLERGELFMTTGVQSTRWRHEVLTRHGLLWVHRSQLVWRAPAKDNRQAKRIT